MTPAQTDVLLVAVKDLRDDMGRRFEDVKSDFAEVKDQLAIVDGRLTKVETNAAIAADRVVQAKAVADDKVAEAALHVLSFRWRVTIAIAAAGALFGAFLGTLNFMVGH